RRQRELWCQRWKQNRQRIAGARRDPFLAQREQVRPAVGWDVGEVEAGRVQEVVAQMKSTGLHVSSLIDPEHFIRQDLDAIPGVREVEGGAPGLCHSP